MTVLASFAVIMGRAPADVFSGAIYTLFFRPFDIGDRIYIAQPGRVSSPAAHEAADHQLFISFVMI